MARGTPDWGEYSQQDLFAKSFDLAELAVRLGCPSVFHRDGTILFMDTFDYGLSRWTKYEVGNCTINVSTDKAFFKDKSLKFAFSGLATDASKIELEYPYLFTKSYGFECTLNFNGSKLTFELDGMKFYNNVCVECEVRIEPENNLIKIYTPGGWITLCTDLKICTDGRMWNFLKMVVDFEAGKYKYLILNDRVFDLSAYSLYSYNWTTYDDIEVKIYVANNEDAVKSLYVGSVIITTNEP